MRVNRDKCSQRQEVRKSRYIASFTPKNHLLSANLSHKKKQGNMVTCWVLTWWHGHCSLIMIICLLSDVYRLKCSSVQNHHRQRQTLTRVKSRDAGTSKDYNLSYKPVQKFHNLGRIETPVAELRPSTPVLHTLNRLLKFLVSSLTFTRFLFRDCLWNCEMFAESYKEINI